MFKLYSPPIVYDWHRLLLILTMERTQIFLGDIKFPLPNEIHTIRQIAREFVQRFYDIELRLFNGGEISEEGQKLFSDVYQELCTAIGQDAADQFCNWGNHLYLDHSPDIALYHLWRNISARIRIDDDTTDLGLPDALQPKSHLIRTIISRCESEFRILFPILDYIEAIPKDEWDTEAYRIYNIGDRRDVTEVDIRDSPLYYIEWVIKSVKTCRAICELTRLVTGDEVEHMMKWLNSHFEEFGSVQLSDLIKICEEIDSL